MPDENTASNSTAPNDPNSQAYEQLSNSSKALNDSYSLLTETGQSKANSELGSNSNETNLVKGLNPISGLKNLLGDLGYSNLFPENLPGGKYTQKALNVAAIPAVGLGIVAIPNSGLPHEYTHTAANEWTGGTSSETTDTYVIPEAIGPWPSEDLVAIAPTLWSLPLGYYLLSEGKKRKSLPLAAAGSGLLFGDALSVLSLQLPISATEKIRLTGDFNHVGADIVQKTTEAIQTLTSQQITDYKVRDFDQQIRDYYIHNTSFDYPTDPSNPYLVSAAFLLGVAILGSNYGVGRAAVNKIRKWRKKGEKTIVQSTQERYNSNPTANQG